MESSINISRKDFIGHYLKNILPELNKHSQELRKVLLRYNAEKYLLIASPIILFLFIFISIIQIPEFSRMFLGILLVSFVISAFAGMYCFYYFIAHTKRDTYRFVSKMKKLYMNKLLEYFGDVNWVEENSSKENDFLKGTYKDVPFVVSEFSENIQIEFKSNKTFNSDTLIKVKHDTSVYSKIVETIFLIPILTFMVCNVPWVLNNMFERLYMMLFFIIVFSFVIVSRIISTVKYLITYRKTKLEDVDLEKDFIVKTNDEVECRYFLTPAFIERFKYLQTAFGRKNISCTCKKGIINFSFTKSDNLFEICDVEKGFDEPSVINKFYDEIVSIFSMIEYFKFNENTKI